ncbi:hypothetical protein K525DRAFT_248576 [Schizophyllum commune Loenen D]|nr:hypothetical protein K525DRAFT_248576 [Schizophyllum commune Loenen D]
MARRWRGQRPRDQIQEFSSEVRLSKAPLQRQARNTANSVLGSAFFTSCSTSTIKRRKRGARRGKGNNGNQTPASVASGAEPGAMVDILAEASQKLAREISRVSHPKSDVIEEVPRTATAPPRVPSVGQPSTSSVRSGNSRQSVASGQSVSSASTTTWHNWRVPYEPPSMWGVPDALCTNNARPTSQPALGKVATTQRIIAARPEVVQAEAFLQEERSPCAQSMRTRTAAALRQVSDALASSSRSIGKGIITHLPVDVQTT